MISFPTTLNRQNFRAWRSEPELWLPIAVDIARGLSLPHAEVEVFTTGTNLVLGLGNTLILKIYPPFLRHQYFSERTTLRLLQGRLDILVPEVVAEGERDGWPYLVMSRIPGKLGTDVWPDLAEDQKTRVLRQIGTTIAQVQSVPLSELAPLEPQWPEFLKTQIANCRSRHISLGLPDKFLGELDVLISEAPALIPIDKSPVILTGEYIPENFILTSRDAVWDLAGIIDFGDVMTGWREYDLLGPSAFMTAGYPRRVQSLLSGFGYTHEDLTPSLGRRLLTLMFLHRASDPMKHICIPGWERDVETLDDLQRILWPFDGMPAARSAR